MPSNRSSLLGKKLTELREAAGLSKRQLAVALGTSGASAISNHESGNMQPQLKSLERYADIYNVELKLLINLTVRDYTISTYGIKLDDLSFLAGEVLGINQYGRSNFLGTLIKELRIAHSLEQNQLGQLIGLKGDSIQVVEAGRAAMNPKRLLKLIEVLDADKSVLVKAAVFDHVFNKLTPQAEKDSAFAEAS